jgi:hypothetical protein
MAIDGDDLISLPTPPPPRPTARREAIDSALRKFDGNDDASAPRRRPSLAGWASAHRGLAGGLVTAALVAVISIPAIQVVIREHPPEVVSEGGLSERAPAEENAADLAPANEPPSATVDRAVAAADEAPSQPKTEPAEQPTNLVAERKAIERTVEPVMATPAPMIAAPAAPPPPPPPPPPQAQLQAEAADSVGNIIVTGSRIPAPKAEGFAQRAEAPPTQREIIAPYGEFLSRVQEALRDNDRRAVLRLVGLPLRVNFAGGARTYRTRQEVERDYDRIFTPVVREAAMNMGSYDIVGRDGGRLRGSGRIWFGCGNRTCSAEEAIRVREVTP